MYLLLCMVGVGGQTYGNGVKDKVREEFDTVRVITDKYESLGLRKGEIGDYTSKSSGLCYHFYDMLVDSVVEASVCMGLVCAKSILKLNPISSIK